MAQPRSCAPAAAGDAQRELRARVKMRRVRRPGGEPRLPNALASSRRKLSRTSAACLHRIERIEHAALRAVSRNELGDALSGDSS